MWFTISTFYITCWAFSWIWINSKCIFTTGWWMSSSWKRNLNLIFFCLFFFVIETYGQIFLVHNQQPSCNYNGYEHFLCHRKEDHFHSFQLLVFHWCRGKIGHSSLGVRRPELHTLPDILVMKEQQRFLKIIFY